MHVVLCRNFEKAKDKSDPLLAEYLIVCQNCLKPPPLNRFAVPTAMGRMIAACDVCNKDDASRYCLHQSVLRVLEQKVVCNDCDAGFKSVCTKIAAVNRVVLSYKSTNAPSTPSDTQCQVCRKAINDPQRFFRVDELQMQ